MSELLLGPVVKAYHAAAKTIWNDPEVWIAERDRVDIGDPLQWPRPVVGTVYQRFLAALHNGDVEVVVFVLAMEKHPALPDLPVDVGDPKFQLVLRVMDRSFRAGAAVIEATFGGAERVTGWREFTNEWRGDVVEFLQRSGIRAELGDAAAFAAFGISSSAAFRHMKRKKK